MPRRLPTLTYHGRFAHPGVMLKTAKKGSAIFAIETTFTDSEWDQFCAMISTNAKAECIEFLDLSLSDTRATLLAYTLSGRESIKQIALQSLAGVHESLLRIVPTLVHLDCLVLQRSQLTQADAMVLADALVSNKSIDFLELNDNPNLGHEGSLAIITALRGHPKLRNLYMNNTGMTDDTVEAIATDLLPSLPRLQGLEVLALQSHRCIGNRGALSLAKALSIGSKCEASVNRLRLGGCNITELHLEWLQTTRVMLYVGKARYNGDVDVPANPIRTVLSVETASQFMGLRVVPDLGNCPTFLEANNVPFAYSLAPLLYIVWAGDGHTSLGRARVVFIGDYGQGKSWLARNLSQATGSWKQGKLSRWVTRKRAKKAKFSSKTDDQEQPRSRLPSLPSTHVMETSQLVSAGITVLLQDLGGQQVYRTLQTLLLHGSPLYVYCVNLAKATEDATSLATHAHAFQAWVDILMACHDEKDQVARTKIKLITTHADIIGSEAEIGRRLLLLKNRFLSVLSAPEYGGRIQLMQGIYAVDNYDTLRCWAFPVTTDSKLVVRCFADLAREVARTAMGIAALRYDPNRVPKRWASLYGLIMSTEGVIMSWSDLADRARQLDPPIKTDDELDFVFRLVREWTGVVSFRDSQYEDLRNYIFLDSGWFIRAVGSLFIIHHHLQHDSFKQVRDEHNVKIIGHLGDDFDSRDPPPLPVVISEVYKHLPELFQCGVLSRELLSKLMAPCLEALEMETENGDPLSLLISVLRELDIIVRLPQAVAGSERFLCPSLMSTVQLTLPDPIRAQLEHVETSGHYHQYLLPRGLSQVFYRIIAKLCQHAKLITTRPVVIDHPRALWVDVARPDSHALLVRYEGGVVPRLAVHILGETVSEHDYATAVQEVLSSSTLWQKSIVPTMSTQCPHASGCSACGQDGTPREEGQEEKEAVCDLSPMHIRSRDQGVDIAEGLNNLRVDTTEVTESENGEAQTAPPRDQDPFVFVSYKWNEENVPMEWVQEEFVPQLRELVGERPRIVLDIDKQSKIDQGIETKNVWMSRMCREAALVIVVCSPGYVRASQTDGGVHLEFVYILSRLLSEAKKTTLVLGCGVNFDDSVPEDLKPVLMAHRIPEDLRDLAAIVKSVCDGPPL